VIPPLNQSVVVGGDATFSIQISGNPPPFGYQLKISSFASLASVVTSERTAFLTLTNVQLSNAGIYRVAVTNAANPSPGILSAPLTLTVLTDSDHDGLPDEWESAHDLNPNERSDAALDSDGDGRTSLEEYLAGTDPQDAQSVLRIESIALANGGSAALVQFKASSNATYTVQRRSSFQSPWTNVAAFVAFPTNRTVSLMNELNGTNAQFYRIVTPHME
jgi:hypothetical protein